MCWVYFCLCRIGQSSERQWGLEGERTEAISFFFFFFNIYPHLSVKISNGIKMQMFHNKMFHKMQMLNILSFRFMLHVLLESWLLGIKDSQTSLSPSITNSEAYRDQKLKGGPLWSFPHPQRWDSISSLKVQLLPSFSRILTMLKYGPHVPRSSRFSG